ncbi:MAG TPA: hypothetical protein VLM37_09345 [Fibrobacteraceae bacterium]|nr:hypothetical protein [Fibrobacteraceae bacterium]
MYKFWFPYLVVLGLAGCLQAPETQGQPENVRIVITNLYRDSVQDTTLRPKSALCLYAQLTADLDSSGLSYRWSLDDSLLDTVSAPCFVLSLIGYDTLILWAEDAAGNLWSDSLFLLMNTPPKFSTDSALFSPARDTLVYASNNLGLPFVWSAMDGDDDSLIFNLFLWTNSGWSDTIQTQSTAGFNLPDTLLAATTYFWRMRVEDPWGASDSTATFTFVTRESWDLPGMVHGYVALPSPDSTEFRDRIRVVALTENGDSASFSLDSTAAYSIYPGPQIDNLQLYAWDPLNSVSSDTITLSISNQQSNPVADTLEFP